MTDDGTVVVATPEQKKELRALDKLHAGVEELRAAVKAGESPDDDFTATEGALHVQALKDIQRLGDGFAKEAAKEALRTQRLKFTRA
jgi:hypothetical protein